jgi:hypothetical protein
MRKKIGWLIEKVRDDLQNEYPGEHRDIVNALNRARREFGETLQGWEKLGPDEGDKLVRPLRGVAETLKAIEGDLKSSDLENHWARWVKEPRRYIEGLADAIESGKSGAMDDLERKLKDRSYHEEYEPSKRDPLQEELASLQQEEVSSKIKDEMTRTFSEEVDGFRARDATAEFETGFARFGVTLQVRGEMLEDEETVKQNVERLADRFFTGDPMVRMGRNAIEVTWHLIPIF